MTIASSHGSSTTFASDELRWQAVRSRDPRARGAFIYAVTSTGVACRPACSSRTPRRENVVYFASAADAVRAGFRLCKRCHAGAAAPPTKALVARACRLLEGSGEPVRVEAVARAVGLDPSSLARAFRERLGVSPGQYRRRVLAARARAALAASDSVTAAVYAAGFSASSRFYDGPGRELGMQPRDARRGGRGQALRYAVATTGLGALAIAWTPRGVADVFFADVEADAAAELAARWPAATRERVEAPGWLAPLVRAVERPGDLDLPLDVQGTAFQERVWQALRRIPLGETRSYSSLAAELGVPRATRAVAGAVAANRLALLVPCHRVVGRDGALRGYRWGEERKRALLEREQQTAASDGRRAPAAGAPRPPRPR